MRKTPEEDGFNEFGLFFRFIKNLGAGAFGKVILGEDLANSRRYAVKVLFKMHFLFFKCIATENEEQQTQIIDKCKY